MSTRTDLTINVLNNVSGKKTTNKLSYVNPNITNNQAVALAEMITNLTKDTYQSTTRTDTTDCDIQTPLVFVLNYSNTDYSAGATINIPLSAVNESNAFSVNGKCVPSSTEYTVTRPTYTSTDLVPTINQMVLYTGGTTKFETKLAEKTTGSFVMNVHVISTNPNIADFDGAWTINIVE